MRKMDLFGDTYNVLSIQDKFDICDRVYPNSNCNYKHALPVYKRLFQDYNNKFGTMYEDMFWGFSELLQDNLEDPIYRATEILQIGFDNGKVILILQVPKGICLETDFYNFSDEIFAYEFPNELKSDWENIYSDRHSEKQVIFPYIEKSMIIKQYNLSDFKQILNKELRR